jgi:hypothetical protein
MTPRVTVVTTVWDRVECLARCLRAMEHSQFTEWEQIVVADCPPPPVEAEIRRRVEAHERARLTVLPRRANDWGMTPAYAGLREAAGEYVAFLSDDNAYLPDHFGPLVAALDADPGLGFAYSSCQYAARKVLRTAPPRGALIDLGQPLFRRDTLRANFPAGFPFKEFAWDWRVIAALMAAGVRWKHVDRPTFVFRLEAYPKIAEALA